jgi:hypothetical protein
MRFFFEMDEPFTGFDAKSQLKPERVSGNAYKEATPFEYLYNLTEA